MQCFLLGLIVVIGVFVGLFLLMALIGAPIFRIRESKWPELDDLFHSITYGYFGLCAIAIVFIVAVMCTAIGCAILGR